MPPVNGHDVGPNGSGIWNIVSAVAPTGRIHADRQPPASYRICRQMTARILLIANAAIHGVDGGTDQIVVIYSNSILPGVVKAAKAYVTGS